MPEFVLRAVGGYRGNAVAVIEAKDLDEAKQVADHQMSQYPGLKIEVKPLEYLIDPESQ